MLNHVNKGAPGKQFSFRMYVNNSTQHHEIRQMLSVLII